MDQIINCVCCLNEYKRSEEDVKAICPKCIQSMFFEFMKNRPIRISAGYQEATIHLTDNFHIRLDWNEVRWLYYKVLNLKIPHMKLEEEIRNIDPSRIHFYDVNVPEDILFIEHALEMRKKQNGENNSEENTEDLSSSSNSE